MKYRNMAGMWYEERTIVKVVPIFHWFSLLEAWENPCLSLLAYFKSVIFLQLKRDYQKCSLERKCWQTLFLTYCHTRILPS